MASPLSPIPPAVPNSSGRVEVSLEQGIVVFKADDHYQPILRETTQSSSSVSEAITTLAKRDSSLKRLCENPNFKTALKVALVAAIVIGTMALALTQVGLFAAVTIGIVGLALYGLFETRAYGTKLFVKSHKIQVEQAQRVEEARAQLSQTPTPIKLADLLLKTSSMKEIQIILQAAKKIPELKSDTIAKFESMITSATSPLDPQKVKKFLVRYFIHKNKIDNLKKLASIYSDREWVPTQSKDFLPTQFRHLMEQFFRKQSTKEADELTSLHEQINLLQKQLDQVLRAEDIVKNPEKMHLLMEEIEAIRSQLCELNPSIRDNIHTIQNLINRSSGLAEENFDPDKPFTVGDLEKLKLDFINFKEIIQKTKIFYNEIGLIKDTLIAIDNLLDPTKEDLENLVIVEQLANHEAQRSTIKEHIQPVLTGIARELEVREGALYGQTKHNQSVYLKYVREETLLADVFKATFKISLQEAKAFEDALYTDIRSLLDTPNFAPYKEELERAYPPRGNP